MSPLNTHSNPDRWWRSLDELADAAMALFIGDSRTPSTRKTRQ